MVDDGVLFQDVVFGCDFAVSRHWNFCDWMNRTRHLNTFIIRVFSAPRRLYRCPPPKFCRQDWTGQGRNLWRQIACRRPSEKRCVELADGTKRFPKFWGDFLVRLVPCGRPRCVYSIHACFFFHGAKKTRVQTTTTKQQPKRITHPRSNEPRRLGTLKSYSSQHGAGHPTRLCVLKFLGKVQVPLSCSKQKRWWRIFWNKLIVIRLL